MTMLRTLLALAASLPLSLAPLKLASAQTGEAGYRFSPVNQYDIPLMAAYWNPIIQYISDKSGVKLTLKIARTSADTTAYVLTQEVEFVFSNHLFSPEREQLGWKVFGRRQVPPIMGQIVVPEDSPITRLEQLKGQEVAFAGPEAFVIYKVPYAHLLNSGIDVKVVFGGNQNGALAQLFAGKAMAAGGNSQLIEGYAKREGKKFRVLWSSEPFNDLALMVSGKVPEKDARAVAQAFLTMHEDPAGRQVLRRTSEMVGLPMDAHFIPATLSDYTAYRRFYQSAPPQLR
ncbi:phosphate/phosphite/phosphonate ABC transporter substrate-binding protein [Hylemonella gracilis]|nr:phosphate/phosphite/phosphonate ABC transporter substrate-binding protein [Hylemonella gracilis]